MQVDINGTSSDVLLWHLSQYLKTKNPGKKKIFYDQFRQGLDILDLDPIVYAIISKNQTSISNWFPQLINGVKATGFFKVPKTKIMKVPMPVLQLTRIQRESWTPITIAIVNRFCHKAFDLDDSKDYFIKTGVFSSKYEFRNAHVHGEKEVQELGEYLLFIHYQACIGEIEPKDRIQVLIERAKYGHPDNMSTQAARRVCKKRGIDWENYTDWDSYIKVS